MARFIVICAAIFLLFGFYRNWFTVSEQSNTGDKMTIGATLDKGKIQEDTSGAVSKIKDFSQSVKTKAGEAVSSSSDNKEANPTIVSWDNKSIRLEHGTKARVNGTRSGGTMKDMQVGLSVSSGSGVLVSGGLFRAGETETTLTIEAPKSAHDGTITVLADGKTEVLTVTIQ